MIRILLRAALVALFCFGPGVGVAEDDAPAPVARPIPYKTDVASVEDQGARTVAVLVALLALTAGGLYWLRRRIPKLAGLAGDGARLQVVERIRLNPRNTMYLVRLDGNEILLVQCGDTITQINVAGVAHPAASATETVRE
ncbi:MAG: flagellar biosynthetic protein FliO [Rhodocyclales bacterium]|nr:flagellar biosynthetic protein FliO [Rhodocyclales bacterium]